MLRYVLLAAALAACGRAAGGDAAIAVSAAVSLTEVLGELAAKYEARTGTRVVLNFGASNTLARQIAVGARVDLFISADEAQMALVAAHIDRASQVALVANQLAIAVPDDRPRRFASARDLTGASIRRIALGDPSAVPAGVYARAYLQKIGIWDDLAPKIVPAGSVRLALAAVENGAADAAIVYRTDIAIARRVREAFVVPVADGPRIVYPAALVRQGTNVAGARRFLEFLRGREAFVAFERAGFLRP